MAEEETKNAGEAIKEGAGKVGGKIKDGIGGLGSKIKNGLSKSDDNGAEG